jgi:hypothetical protein
MQHAEIQLFLNSTAELFMRADLAGASNCVSAPIPLFMPEHTIVLGTKAEIIRGFEKMHRLADQAGIKGIEISNIELPQTSELRARVNFRMAFLDENDKKRCRIVVHAILRKTDILGQFEIELIEWKRVRFQKLIESLAKIAF